MADETRVNAYIRDIECMFEDFSHWNELTEFEKLDHDLEWSIAIQEYWRVIKPAYDHNEMTVEMRKRSEAIVDWLRINREALEKAHLVTLETKFEHITSSQP